MKLVYALASAVVLLAVTAAALYFLKISGNGAIRLKDAGYAQATSWNGGCLILPADATHVYAYDRTGGGYFQRHCHFTVAPARVEAAVEEIAAKEKKRLKKEVVFKRTDLKAAERELPGITNDVPWWTPETITEGFYEGAEDPYAAHIWADKASGEIFVYHSD